MQMRKNMIMKAFAQKRGALTMMPIKHPEIVACVEYQYTAQNVPRNVKRTAIGMVMIHPT